MNISTARTLQALGLAGLSVLAAPQAWALEGGFGYGGVSLGRSQGSFGSEAQVATGLAPGASVSSFARDTRDTGFKVFGGVQFNRNLALEAGYFDLGKPGYTATTTPVGTVDARFRLNGANLDLVGMLPLGTQLSALMRVGVVAGRTRATFVTTGPVALADVSQRRTNGKLGLGLQYSLGTSLLLRAEVERYRFNDGVVGHVNVNHLSVGLVVPFGAGPGPMARAPQPAPAYIPPPAPVVMAPAPVIVVQAPPPPVVIHWHSDIDQRFRIEPLMRPLIRATLAREGFVEVETPVLHTEAGGAHARPPHQGEGRIGNVHPPIQEGVEGAHRRQGLGQGPR
jgi:OOP family OmpA-OmpF porin